MRNVTFVIGKPEETLLKYDNRKKNNNKTFLKKCENEKTQCHYNREQQGTGNKMENQK
jgi:uncharacterized phage-like protein YoqJ